VRIEQQRKPWLDICYLKSEDITAEEAVAGYLLPQE
jgi:hypothetical protein